MTIRTALVSGVSVLVFSVGAAHAQSIVGIEEVIVTAQKRSENLQDVPISIATLGSEEVQTIFSGVDDVLALANRIPGLNVESSNGRLAPRFYIRGLGNTDFDSAASQPVSVVMDDMVMENVIFRSFPIFDTQQIEVLRGPQGTLFGRNTPAGIVKIDSNKPTDEFGGYAFVNYGTYNTVNGQFAYGGPLLENRVAFRTSGLIQRQDDFVNNDFTGERDVYGAFRELAGRFQLLLTPSQDLSILAAVQYADLNGTASLFRANILGPGNNDLNSNFDRETVYYDGGDGNPGDRSIFTASLKVDYDLSDEVTLTSITSYADLDKFSRGDIDGGAIDFGTGLSIPGFIPFPSDTSGASTADQFSQEIRLASTDGGPLQWQVGAFYFDGTLNETTDPNLAFLGISPTDTISTDEAWAIFGQASYDLTELLTFTAGVRYAEDEKTFRVTGPPVPGFLLGNGTDNIKVDDGEVSWDVSLSYAATDDVNVYGRVARGFRGPSIQGRNVAFVNDVTTADTETVISYEIGFKSILADNKLRLNSSAFYYEVTDIQLTAVGGENNLVGLLNSDKADAWGFDVDLEFVPDENWLFQLGFSYADTELKQDGLSVAVCAQCTVTDPLDANGFAIITGNPFPQSPKTALNVAARYSVPFRNGELYIHTDWAVQGRTNIFLYESEEFFTSGNFEGGARIGYIFGDDGGYEFAFFARNITDEENVIGGIDFNNNTGFVNQPRIIGASLKANF